MDIASRIIIVDHLGIIAYCRSIVRNVLGDDTAGADRDIVSDLHIFNDADVGSDIGIVSDRGRMVLVAADRGELGKIAVVADDGGRIDYDRTAMTDIQTIADAGVAGDLDVSPGPVEPPKDLPQYLGKALALTKTEGALKTERRVSQIAFDESGSITFSVIAVKIALDILVHDHLSLSFSILVLAMMYCGRFLVSM